MDYRPNFFIVGQPKSGTTALHSMLNQHPDIFMSQDKEPKYFCYDLKTEALSRSKDFIYKFRYPTEKKYMKLFFAGRYHKIRGESTTVYLYSKVAAEEIYKFNPKAQILMILRNPIDYLISAHTQLSKMGLESEYDFQKAFSLEQLRKQGLNIPKLADTPSLLYYSERIKYTEQVLRYISRFNRHQIKVLIYEDYRTDNIGVTRSVFEFLGVDKQFEPKPIEVNRQQTPRNKVINEMMFNPAFKRSLQRILPLKVLQNPSIVNIAKSILWKERKGEPLPEEFISQLYTLILPEVEKISELLKMDLVREWGFDKYQ